MKKFNRCVAIDKGTGEILTTKAMRHVGKDASGDRIRFAASPGFGYDPRKARLMYDVREGGRRKFSGKKTKLIGKTWKDYGLPSASTGEGANSSPPKLLPRPQTRYEARQILRSVLLDGKETRKIETPVETILVKKSMLDHVIAKDFKRAMFSRFYIDAMQDPLEIWLSRETRFYRKRYIKLYQQKKMKKLILVIAEENHDGETLFFNAIPTNDAKYVDKQRTGVLLYRKGQGEK